MKERMAFGLASCALSLAGCATALNDATVEQRTADVMHRSFASAGPEWLSRLKQDEAQALCTRYRNRLPTDERQRLEKAQLATVIYPSGGLIGNWREGEKIALEGRGLQFSDKPGGPVGGNCYACHQLAPKEVSFGTIGPSLHRYGKLRGNSEETAKYTYGKIYNAQAYTACSNMPRFGHNKILTEQQLKDVVAFLLDPQSPVNQ